MEKPASIEVLMRLEEGIERPTYASVGSSGADVKAFIKQAIVLAPSAICLVPTGIYLAIPEGYEIQVRPRSGLALKHGLTILNTPGTIDADYRGEIGIILINHSKEPFTITPHMRIAQLVLAPVVYAKFVVQEQLPATLRGIGGYGHTGTH